MICLYGGTFDPVHRGHLRAAEAVCDALGLDNLKLVLSARPSHRGDAGASMEARWEMLKLACSVDGRLEADDRELRRERPSFTVETLEALRAELPAVPIGWVIGSDAYRLLPSWYRWEAVAELANLIVLNRPGHPLELDDIMRAFTAERRVDDLTGHHSGAVLLLEAPLLEISAAEVRGLLGRGASADHLLPDVVATYIREYSLYGVVSDA